MTPEFFDEAVIVLNRLGECESVKYSFYATKADYNSLAWDLVYSLEEEPVRWYLYLADDQDEIMVRGFSFDR